MESKVAPERIANFRIVGVLGRGGMGVVYRAHDEALRRDVALKVLPETDNEERRQRFMREARAAASITHPNVAVVHQVGEDAGRVFIAMELVAGESLRGRLGKGALDASVALDLAKQIAKGLTAAHERGIVHRDLKPENVIITPDGVVKLLDFGLAKGASRLQASSDPEAALAKTETVVTSDEGRIMGTPEYMSPEQAMGEPVDVRSDVFSFGIVLYEMLAGNRPFGGASTGAVLVAIARDPVPPIRKTVPGIDASIEAVVIRCLEKAPAARFASAAEILAALDGRGSQQSPMASTRSGSDVVAVMPSGASPTGSRGRWVAALALVLLVAAGVSVARRMVRTRATSVPAASASSPAPAASSSKPFRLIDLPSPKTDSAEALEHYRKALGDMYDAVQAPQSELNRAHKLDASFAAAWLRLAFALDRPASTMAYENAFRNRDRLDERDRALLAAEEPCDVPERPDFAECKRRFVVLEAERPTDVELVLRLARIESRMQPGSQLATCEHAAQLDPAMAAAESCIAVALQSLDRESDALAHVRRCESLSPTAAMCMVMEGEIAAHQGRCADLADAVRRASFLAPDDMFIPLERIGASLTTGQPREAIDMDVDRLAGLLDRIGPSALRGAPPEAITRGAVALWFGDYPAAVRALDEFGRAQESATVWWTYDELCALEEMGDENAVRTYLRRYVGERATSPGGWDPLAIRALRVHHVLRDAETAGLHDKWARLWSQPMRPWFEVAAAVTPEEARAALASVALDSSLAHADPDDDYLLGRALSLAGRPSDAAPLLERAARACQPFEGYINATYVPYIIRASFELGSAREALGDHDGACDAYRTVLGHWGQATPRSVTAERAKSHATTLGCAL